MVLIKGGVKVGKGMGDFAGGNIFGDEGGVYEPDVAPLSYPIGGNLGEEEEGWWPDAT